MVISSPELIKTINEPSEQLAEKHNDGWILCSKKLPNEPNDQIGYADKYIVTIEKAIRSTVLQYVGAGRWWNEQTKIFYKVIAWQPLPEAYKPKENKMPHQMYFEHRFTKVE